MSSGRRAVTDGSFCRTAPAAALRGFANVGVPASSRLRLSRANSSRGMNTSPRASMTGAAASGPRKTIGIVRIVRRFGVMSSPTRPSPRVAPRTKRPCSYKSAMPRPSILGSHTYVKAAPGSARPIRAANSRRSSGEVALSSESMASWCSTDLKTSVGAPPTRWVGLSAVTRSGKLASSARSSRMRASYSASETSGRAST